MVWRHGLGDLLAKRETLEFVRAYYKKITDPGVRKRVFELTKAVSKAVGNVKDNSPELLDDFLGN